MTFDRHRDPLSPVEQLQQSLSECGSLVLFQPELRIIRVADQRPSAVQVPVNQRVVSLPPVLQTGVHPLHQEVHHPTIGRVADKQHLGVNFWVNLMSNSKTTGNDKGRESVWTWLRPGGRVAEDPRTWTVECRVVRMFVRARCCYGNVTLHHVSSNVHVSVSFNSRGWVKETNVRDVVTVGKMFGF